MGKQVKLNEKINYQWILFLINSLRRLKNFIQKKIGFKIGKRNCKVVQFT